MNKGKNGIIDYIEQEDDNQIRGISGRYINEYK
jgi:hypothetical protein